MGTVLMEQCKLVHFNKPITIIANQNTSGQLIDSRSDPPLIALTSLGNLGTAKNYGFPRHECELIRTPGMAVGF